MDPIYILFIPALLLAVVVHELAHALVAWWGGDDTAALQGRLTFNPIPHIDPIGTLLVPAILILTHSGFLFGWARPVPINPMNLKNSRWIIWVSLAGPASNLLLLIVSAIVLKLYLVSVNAFPALAISETIAMAVITILRVSIILNFILMLFNLIPIPPLDGSKVVFELFLSKNRQAVEVFAYLERFGFLIIILMLQPLGSVLHMGLRVLSRVLEATLGIVVV